MWLQDHVQEANKEKYPWEGLDRFRGGLGMLSPTCIIICIGTPSPKDWWIDDRSFPVLIEIVQVAWSLRKMGMAWRQNEWEFVCSL